MDQEHGEHEAVDYVRFSLEGDLGAGWDWKHGYSAGGMLPELAFIVLPGEEELANLSKAKEAPFVPIMAELPAEESGPDGESRQRPAGGSLVR